MITIKILGKGKHIGRGRCWFIMEIITLLNSNHWSHFVQLLMKNFILPTKVTKVWLLYIMTYIHCPIFAWITIEVAPLFCSPFRMQISSCHWSQILTRCVPLITLDISPWVACNPIWGKIYIHEINYCISFHAFLNTRRRYICICKP